MDINYIGILITTTVAVVLGMGWFGPIFGKVWAEIIGMKQATEMTPEENKEFQKKMAPAYIINIVLTGMMMVGLFFFVKGSNAVSGITASFIAWLFFALPLMGGQALWSGKAKRLAWQMFLLTTGYQLICFVVAGAIYSAM
jgi:hypothetical protein